MGSSEPAEMGLFDHLAELRRRLLISAVAVLLMAIVGFIFSTPLFDILNAPYYDAFPNEKLIGTGPAEAFVIRLKVALFAGLILASPVIFHQVWLFVAPGLYEHEKKLVIPFVISTTALFITGLLFGYYVIFPFAFSFFHDQYVSINVTPAIRMSEHLSAMVTGLLGFGAVFQMPVMAFLLGRLGVLNDGMMIRSSRYAIVVIFIVAAVLTPPDVITQFLFAGPLLILYGVSILIVRYTHRPKKSLEEASAPT